MIQIVINKALDKAGTKDVIGLILSQVNRITIEEMASTIKYDIDIDFVSDLNFVMKAIADNPKENLVRLTDIKRFFDGLEDNDYSGSYGVRFIIE